MMNEAQQTTSPNPYNAEYLMIQGALVKLLCEPISWRMRVQIGDAMLTIGRHYESMVKEQNDTAAAYAAEATKCSETKGVSGPNWIGVVRCKLGRGHAGDHEFPES